MLADAMRGARKREALECWPIRGVLQYGLCDNVPALEHCGYVWTASVTVVLRVQVSTEERLPQVECNDYLLVRRYCINS